jgi:hypothetical protein
LLHVCVQLPLDLRLRIYASLKQECSKLLLKVTKASVKLGRIIFRTRESLEHALFVPVPEPFAARVL